MGSRIKLQNKKTFKFDENDVLPLPASSVSVHKRRSVQERLVPKHGSSSRTPSLTGGERPVEALALSPSLSNNNYNYSRPPVRKPKVTQDQPRRSADPVLDRIVAKLKSELSVSESEGGESGPSGVCLCERGPQLVLCSVCGAITTGRAALTCPSHPRRKFLQDLTQCFSCPKGGLDNLKEYELPQGVKESLKKVERGSV